LGSGFINNETNKPKLTSRQLVDKLRDEKGVTFKIVSEAEAELYFLDRNNYLRTAAYRKNYEKFGNGENLGKYKNLDFAYLKELSTIDMHLRYLLLKMCIDIEHSLKVQIIQIIEKDEKENGYQIVKTFLQKHPGIIASIEKKADSVFTGELIDKYFSLCYIVENDGRVYTRITSIDCPVWVLMEIISFGDLIKLHEFYQRQYGLKNFDNNIMSSIKSLRNACAHNNCLINDLHPRTSRPPASISNYVSRISSIANEERQRKLTCRAILEFVCLLYEYEKIITPDIKKYRYDELKKLINERMPLYYRYYVSNQLLVTSYRFIKKVVDSLA